MDITRPHHNWPILFLAYFSIQILSRTLTGTSLGLDEAEMMLTARTLEWGYGPQPPLYSWLQHAAFALFGETVFALALVKNALLCLAYLVLFRLFRNYYDNEPAGLAAGSLLLLPQIAWESQRALSHSVLAAALVAVTLASFARLCKKPDISSYLLFGLSVALGALSKFNYLFFLVALLIAALSLQSTRSLILTPKILLTFGTVGAILFFPIRWLINHQHIAFSSAHKFKIAQTTSKFQATLEGLFDLSLASLSFLALLIAVMGFLYVRYRGENSRPFCQPVLHQIMIRTVMTAMLLTLTAVLLTNTTNVKDRWLQPILILAAPATVLWLLPMLSQLAQHRLRQIVFSAALLICLILPINNLYGDFKKPSRRNTPFPALIKEITEAYPSAEAIFAQNKWLGGNLRHNNKNWNISAVGNAPEYLPEKVVFVWQANSPLPPSNMINELKRLNRTVITINPSKRINIPYPLNADAVFSVNVASVIIK